jgi:hypothetical protein
MKRPTMFGLAAALLTTACGDAAGGSVETGADDVVVDSSVRFDPEPLPADEPAALGPVAPSPHAEIALADLAHRLAVDAAAIVVVSSEDVTWSDGSLGCPEPGMRYTQALVNGTRVILEYEGV